MTRPNFVDTNEDPGYRKYMDKRIAYAMDCKHKSGVVPEEWEIDAAIPIPLKIRNLIGGTDSVAPHLARLTKRNMSYGLCGISYYRNKWMGRVELDRKHYVETFDTAVEAARWYNGIESEMRKDLAVLCSIPAAQLVDEGVIDWSHVIRIKRGRARARPTIMRIVAEREENA